MKELKIDVKNRNRKKITLNRKKTFKHPQGKKISSDLYKALSILADQFSLDFVQREEIQNSVVERMRHIYRESFKRYFKERDFLNLDLSAVNYFEKDFKDSLVYKTTLLTE